MSTIEHKLTKEYIIELRHLKYQISNFSSIEELGEKKTRNFYRLAKSKISRIDTVLFISYIFQNFDLSGLCTKVSNNTLHNSTCKNRYKRIEIAR